LSPQSATTDITCTITVASGVFAPGHLGELTQVIPFELVDTVLEETGVVQQRLRDLPFTCWGVPAAGHGVVRRCRGRAGVVEADWWPCGSGGPSTPATAPAARGWPATSGQA
jgi:hypothetical protein